MMTGRAGGPGAGDRRVFVDVPVLCGHRGSGSGIVAGRRENSLASFRAAVAAGLRWVEVDARRTADDVLVASHEPIVDDGRFIADLGAAETDELGMLRVADLLAALPTDVAIDIDVKTSLEDALRTRAETTAALVAELALAERARRRVLVTSFDPAALLIVREHAPEVPIGLLTWTRFPLRKAIPAAVHLGVNVLIAQVASFALDEIPGPRVERGAAHAVAVAHETGLQVAAWCPDPAEAQQLVAAGVDCLIVDDFAARWRSAGRAGAVGGCW